MADRDPTAAAVAPAVPALKQALRRQKRWIEEDTRQ